MFPSFLFPKQLLDSIDASEDDFHSGSKSTFNHIFTHYLKPCPNCSVPKVPMPFNRKLKT
jgi:uncharacterized GH25 family protein